MERNCVVSGDVAHTFRIDKLYASSWGVNVHKRVCQVYTGY